MPRFIVETDESVTGCYEVEAPNEDAALEMFARPPFVWQDDADVNGGIVEQISYEAYSADIKKISPA